MSTQKIQMKSLKTLSIFSLVFTLAACGNLRIKADQTYMPSAEVKNAALLTFYVAPPVLPEVPAADAKAFNDKVFALSTKLNESLQASSDRYYQTLANGLRLQLGVNILYGKSLQERPRFDRLKQKEDLSGLSITGEKKFPKIQISEGGLHLFEIENGDLKAYIEGNPRMRGAIRNAIKSLDCELVAFAYARPVIDRVTTFGAKANLRLLVDIYLYNANGELAGHTYGETVPIAIDGEELSDYQGVLDLYAALQTEMLTALTATSEEEDEE